MPTTLYDKIWNSHLVHQQEDGTALLFVDRHLIHEVTSPQAFEGLRNANRKVRNPNLTLAVVDHNIPTTDRSKGIDDDDSRIQIETLDKNCKEFGVKLFGVDDKIQGNALPFPGCTIISNIPLNTDLSDQIISLQKKIKNFNPEKTYFYLPPSSFHMTLFDCCNF